MTTNIVQPTSVSDADLVALCVQGHRGAFRTLVERYQSLICALTYAGCGDVHRSEDLAQETFLQAWKNLGSLNDPTLLRSWLCAIARNLVSSARRKDGRGPAMSAQPDDDALDGPAPTPAEDAIRHEEQTLLWESLERLPEEYREPLVLYYRQEKSIPAVAAALDISEQATRQRLSRGRSMLAARMERLVGRGLRMSGPTKAFTIAVLAAIPGLAASASAATLGAAAIKGGAAKGAASLGVLAGSILGPVIGLGGAYLGYRIGLDQAICAEERQYMRRYWRNLLLLMAIFTVAFLGLFAWVKWMGANSVAVAAVILAFAVAYAVTLLVFCVRYARHIRQFRRQAIAENPEMLAKAERMAATWNQGYKSRWTLLGLPLVHIAMGSSADARPCTAKGWIAIGAKAYGVLFAAGGIAVGAISFGGFSIGLLSWGGFAVGALVWGGLGLGIWSLGGMAVGWKAVGGCALAWKACQGGIAVARDFALGAIPRAAHANDAAAQAAISNDWFFQFAHGSMQHAHWAWLVAAVIMLPMLIRWRAYRKALKAGEPKD